jgi:hypothetical protein
MTGRMTRRIALAAIVGATLLLQDRTGFANFLLARSDNDDEGASGNGTTPDWRALQEALTAAAGATLRIRPGSYRLDASLVVPENTTVVADGVTLTWTAQVRGLVMRSGAAITGGTIIGPGGGTYDSHGYGISAYGRRGRTSSAQPGYIAGPTIRGTRIRGWSFAGVYLGYLRNAQIQDCTIEDIGYCAVGAVSVEDVAIERNLIDGVGGSGAPDSYGIFADRLEDTEIRDPRSRRVRIANNTVRNVSKWEGIDTHAGEDFEIVDNRISGCKFGIAVVGADIFDKIALGARRVTVANNVIEGSDDGAAIVVAGATTGNDVNQYAEDCRVVGNRIVKGGRYNDSDEGSIRLYATRNLVVEGNTLDRPRLFGINLIFENRDFRVAGNEIKDVCDNTDTAPSAISVLSHHNTGTIEGNVLRFENTAASSYVAALAINVKPGLTGLALDIGANSRQTHDENKLRVRIGTKAGVSYR